MDPFVVGALYAYAAIRSRHRTGSLAVHLAMAIVAIVMPISESISR
ncbi:MAG TPA: hypothetical protein VFM27_14400 [Acidimicrobiales bacterium]|nr:hypothetical protein [Acidimicrobiales bacterium]